MARDCPHIVLVGPMGVGKTSVGAEVARLLDRSFVDSDAELEKEEHKTSAEIASAAGVAFLHELELRKFMEMTRLPAPSVIASAASIADSAEGLDLLQRCLTVHLTADIGVLMERMRAGEHRREITRGDVLRLNRRRARALERVAAVTFDTSQLSIHEVAVTIVRHLRESRELPESRQGI